MSVTNLVSCGPLAMAANKGRRSSRRGAAVTDSTPLREPTEAELLAAIESLYRDQLRPYGRILRKRLSELAEGGADAPNADVGSLRSLCSNCEGICIESDGEADWSATIAGAPADFVDIYSPEDCHSAEVWAEAASFFTGPGGDAMNCPGGRYVCAQALMALNVPFLKGYTLGKANHFVQLAMTQKKLLGYRDGAIVPYGRSQTQVKEQCAEQQRLCKLSSAPAVTWDLLRACIQDMLTEAGEVGMPLSNVKRVLRARFNYDLSETALGHATVTELFRDDRLKDICTVRLLDNGYYVLPTPLVAQLHIGDQQNVLACSAKLGCEPQVSVLSPSPFVTAPMQGSGEVRPAVPDSFHQCTYEPKSTSDSDPWDLVCESLGMPTSVASTSPPRTCAFPPRSGDASERRLGDASERVPMWVSMPFTGGGVLATAPSCTVWAEISKPGEIPCSNDLVPGAPDVVSDSSSTAPSTPRVVVAPTPSPFLQRCKFDFLLRAEADSSSTVPYTAWNDRAKPDDIPFSNDSVSSSTAPSTPRVFVAPTPSPFLQSCTFDLLLRAAERADMEESCCVKQCGNQAAKHSGLRPTSSIHELSSADSDSERPAEDNLRLCIVRNTFIEFQECLSSESKSSFRRALSVPRNIGLGRNS